VSKVITELLEKISFGQDLTSGEAGTAMKLILEGEVSSEEVAAFLMGMRSKGETVEELTSFVKVLRAEAVPVEVDTDGAVDLCGTGGDKLGTFNISTAAMFVVAGAGVPVLKHGNRSVSSKSGSFDVLKELGAEPALEKRAVESLFNETGMAFMFAPNFHPAIRYVMPARRNLKMRTFFNMLGPLLNPADVKHQVIGAYSRDAAFKMIQILANLETQKAVTISAHDGLDEISVTAPSELFELHSHLRNGGVMFDPESLGYPRYQMKELLGGDAAVNAGILKSIMKNEATDAQRNITELNAAFAIYISGAAESMEEAVAMAHESIASGSALKKLTLFIEESQKAAG
jgi:anthranilate phosphoribosyltransferase